MPVSFKRVPLIKVGKWPVGRSDGYDGPTEVSRADLDRFAANAASGKYPKPVGGLAHRKDREANGLNGTPALADVENVLVDIDPQDGIETLFVDLDAVPEWVAKGYPRRSAEWFKTSDGELVLHRVGFMGDEYPAIDTLADLAAMTTDEGPAPALLAAGAVLCAAAAPSPSPSTKPSPQGPEHTDTEDTGMSLDPKLVARSLGMPEDSTVEAINTEAEARAKALVEEAEKVTETEAVVATEQPTVEADAVTVEAASAAPSKGVLIDPDRLAALEAAAERGVKADEARLRDEAVAIVTAAASPEESKIPDDEKVKAEYVKDLTERGETTRKTTMTLLTAAADQGGFVKGRTSIPTGGHVGHSVTAAATDTQSEKAAALAQLRALRGKTPKQEA